MNKQEVYEGLRNLIMRYAILYPDGEGHYQHFFKSLHEEVKGLAQRLDGGQASPVLEAEARRWQYVREFACYSARAGAWSFNSQYLRGGAGSLEGTIDALIAEEDGVEDAR